MIPILQMRKLELRGETTSPKVTPPHKCRACASGATNHLPLILHQAHVLSEPPFPLGKWRGWGWLP